MVALLDAAADAWTRWDRRPGNRDVVCALHDALAELAAAAGMPWLTLRRDATELRRLGYYPREAIARAAGIDLEQAAA